MEKRPGARGGAAIGVSLRLIGAPATAPTGLTLVDTSAYTQIKRHSQAAEHYTGLASRGLLATCNITSAEVLYSMAGINSIRAMRATLDGLWYLPVTEWSEMRALETLVKLAERGKHGAAKVGDLQIAAVAEQYRATVLHYDHDFDDIAEVTGQATEWIVPRGTGHGG